MPPGDNRRQLQSFRGLRGVAGHKGHRCRHHRHHAIIGTARRPWPPCEAGKHVYVEKPMTRYLPEAFEVYDKVKATGKILQVGSQGCSAAAWHKAAELIHAWRHWHSRLGARLLLPQQQGRRMELPRSHSGSTPQDLDWDKWQQPVHDKTALNPEAYYPLAQVLSVLRRFARRFGAASPAALDAGHRQSRVPHPRRLPRHQQRPRRQNASPARRSAIVPSKSKFWRNSPAA